MNKKQYCWFNNFEMAASNTPVMPVFFSVARRGKVGLVYVVWPCLCCLGTTGIIYVVCVLFFVLLVVKK
jgi:hypothetical protein